MSLYTKCPRKAVWILIAARPSFDGSENFAELVRRTTSAAAWAATAAASAATALASATERACWLWSCPLIGSLTSWAGIGGGGGTAGSSLTEDSSKPLLQHAFHFLRFYLESQQRWGFMFCFVLFLSNWNENNGNKSKTLLFCSSCDLELKTFFTAVNNLVLFPIFKHLLLLLLLLLLILLLLLLQFIK